MRAVWKGAVSFGLVSIGVKLYSATEEKVGAGDRVGVTATSCGCGRERR